MLNDVYRKELERKFVNKIITDLSLNRQIISNQDNKKIPIFDWFPYKEGFAYKLILHLIKDFGKENVTKILDPFVGSGTTLFASRDLGIDSVGIELLPVGEFIFQTRVALEKIKDIEELLALIKLVESLNYSLLDKSENTNFKHLKITEKAFSLATEDKLNRFLFFLENSDLEIHLKQILKFACFAILEKVSYTRKDGQYLRWDARANKGKSDFNKGYIPTFEEAINNKLKKIYNDTYAQSSRFNFKEDKDIRTDLITGSTFNELPRLEKDSIDLIITSPPYLNRYDYTRIYALELAFLGIDEKRIRELRQTLLSSNVESKGKEEKLKEFYSENYGLNFFALLHDIGHCNSALNEILEILDSYKVENKLNNNGIVTMVRHYFYEHVFLIFEMHRVLRTGGVLYYVNDNVRYAGETIPVDLILSEFAEKLGFTIEKIFTLKNGKGNSSQQMGSHGREVMRKCIYKWRKL
jgi:DNA modification methylase